MVKRSHYIPGPDGGSQRHRQSRHGGNVSVQLIVFLHDQAESGSKIPLYKQKAAGIEKMDSQQQAEHPHVAQNPKQIKLNEIK